MIVFQNPGELDIRGVTMLGINAKEGPSAIGFFGTGLKYALAVLLREEQKVEIWSGTSKFSFRLEAMEFRGKAFQRIIMRDSSGADTPLAFSTEFGKNWRLRDAYRELWSNTMDEQGVIFEERNAPSWALTPAESIHQEAQISGFAPREGQTAICVHGIEFAQTHDKREGEILLPASRKLLYEDSNLEIRLGESNFLYYRGIQVHENKKPFLFTYNIKSSCSLTEDRTLLGGTYHLDSMLSSFVVAHAGEELIESILCCGEQYYESEALNFTYNSRASESFLKAAESSFRRRPTVMNKTALDLMFRLKKSGGEMEYLPAELSSGESERLSDALELMKKLGYDCEGLGYRITVTEHCGQGIMGLALRPAKQIMLAKATLSDEEKLLGTLIEEYVHLRFEVNDSSAAMQNVLINELVRLGYLLSASRGSSDEIF